MLGDDTRAVKRVIWILAVLLAAAGIVYCLIPNAQDPTRDLPRAVAKPARNATRLEPSRTDVAYSLDATNTTLVFAAAKTLGGKTLNVTGGWDAQFGSRLDGSILVDSRTLEVRQMRAEIDVGSLWSEHEMLTRNLKTCGFFNVASYPKATFITTAISRAAGGVTTNPTYLVEGNLRLNGIERSLQMPATLNVTADGLRIDSRFALARGDFDVRFLDNRAFPLLDDHNIAPDVALEIHVRCGSAFPSVGATVTPAASSNAPAPAPADLPKTFRQVIPFSQVAFDMVLVPGNPANGIRSFYLGRTEVTWNEFMPWAACKDLPEETQQAQERALRQRPSTPWGTVDRAFGMDQRPALSMSRLAAETYCQWLGKQTGRHYRLPTQKEWDYAYESGGGNLHQPMTREEADRVARWQGNSYEPSRSRNMTLPVGSLAPNALGIFDMAGNVAEWVTDTGTNRIVRGGHYLSPLADLGAGALKEDYDEWGLNDPFEPKSIWWFTDAPWVGFRVVCDP
jgi:polyisoprenoid-binding protein YceI